MSEQGQNKELAKAAVPLLLDKLNELFGLDQKSLSLIFNQVMRKVAEDMRSDLPKSQQGDQTDKFMYHVGNLFLCMMDNIVILNEDYSDRESAYETFLRFIHEEYMYHMEIKLDQIIKGDEEYPPKNLN